jgi:hypothetical protein
MTAATPPGVTTDAPADGSPPASNPSPPRGLRRPVPLWGLLLAVLVALVAAGTAVAVQAMASSDVDEAEADLAAANEATEAEAERADGAESRIAGAEAAAMAAAEAANADRQAELDAEAAALDQRAAQLDAQEADLVAREQAVDAVANGLRASEFGDGVHQVGRDIQPGTYHTEGMVDCYYALLEADGLGVIANNLTNGPATVIIDSPFFESDRCGTWVKVVG